MDVEFIREMLSAARRQRQSLETIEASMGRTVRHIREHRKLSIRRMAILLDVSPSYLEDIENNRTKVSGDFLVRLENMG